MNAKTSTAAVATERRPLPGWTANLAGATALMAAAQRVFPSVGAETTGSEVTKVVLGFIALTDAGPLDYRQIDVAVARHASWGAMRDNIVA